MAGQAQALVNSQLLPHQSQAHHATHILHQRQTRPHRQPHQAHPSRLPIHQQVAQTNTNQKPDQDIIGED